MPRSLGVSASIGSGLVTPQYRTFLPICQAESFPGNIADSVSTELDLDEYLPSPPFPQTTNDRRKNTAPFLHVSGAFPARFQHVFRPEVIESAGVSRYPLSPTTAETPGISELSFPGSEAS